MHHAALPYRDIPKLMRTLAAEPGAAARCLEFVILTATRTNEARRAVWTEIDDAAGVWTVPAGRMKRGKAHKVPLSKAAHAVLARMRADDSNDGTIFRGRLKGRPFAVVSGSAKSQRDRKIHSSRKRRKRASRGSDTSAAADRKLPR